MKTKATKKFLSLALAVVMIMGSAVAMFAYATEGSDPAPATQTTPLDYATAQDGALLYTADFGSDNFTVDQALLDGVESTTNNEDGYQRSNGIMDNDPETPGVQPAGAFTSAGLIINKENSIDTGAENWQQADYEHVEKAIGGWFEDYSLENATYTVTVSVERTDLQRNQLFYFYGYSTAGTRHGQDYFRGTWDAENEKVINGKGTVVGMYNSAQKSTTKEGTAYGKTFGYCAAFYNMGHVPFSNAYQNHQVVVGEGSSAKYYSSAIEYKYVIKGGAKNADGYVPVNVVVFKKDVADGQYKMLGYDAGVATTPYLYVGTGGWDVLRKDGDGNDAIIKLSDMNIYKGNTLGADVFGTDFGTLYNAAEDGDVMWTLNAAGLSSTAGANTVADGYYWRNWDTYQGMTSYDAETGKIIIDNMAYEATAAVPDDPETPDVDETKPAVYGKAGTYGFYTMLPFGRDNSWQQGKYTLELTVNGNNRLGLGLVDGGARRNGFVLDGNNGETTQSNYKVTTDIASGENYRADNHADGGHMGTFLSINETVVRKNTSTDTGDGTEAANVRVVFDFEKYTMSLYELGATTNKWHKIYTVKFDTKKNESRLGANLCFSAHCYDKGGYQEISNVKLYKGDLIGEFKFGFESLYEANNWGVKMLELNTAGMTNPALNGEGGYDWQVRNVAPTVDNDGFIYINSTTGTQQGAYTAHPFAEEWDTGYYTLSFCLNNAARTKMGLFNIVDANGTVKAARVGFAFIANMKYTAAAPEVPATPEVPDDPATEENEYQPANPGSPAVSESLVHDKNGEVYVNAANGSSKTSTMYFGSADSYAFSGYGIQTIIYDKFVDDDKTPNPAYDAENPVEGVEEFLTDEDALPDDPRVVRMQGGNNPNVRIEFNCVDKIITLFERAGGEWHKISALDYSGLEDGYSLTPVFDVYAWDANSQITLKDVEYTKGLQTTHLYSYVAGGIDTGILASDYDEAVVESVLEGYINKYNLGGADLKWSVDGGKTAVEDFATVYANFNDQVFAPKKVNIVPLINYAEMAKAVALRGVKFSAVSEEGKYNVNFVAALGDVDLAAYKAVGFKVTKVTTAEGGVVTATALENVETSDVFEKLNSNGAAIEASAFGGKYVVSAGIKDEVAAEGVQVDYVVSAYVVAQDGTVVEADEAMTFTFIGGEYTPTAPALVIPQA